MGRDHLSSSAPRLAPGLGGRAARCSPAFDRAGMQRVEKQAFTYRGFRIRTRGDLLVGDLSRTFRSASLACEHHKAVRRDPCPRKHRLVSRARRGALPCRRERLRQVDADQDPFGRPRARCGRRDQDGRSGSSEPHATPGTAARHPGHLPGPVAVPEPHGRGEHRNRPGAVGAVQAAPAKSRCATPRRQRLPDSMPNYPSMRL